MWGAQYNQQQQPPPGGPPLQPGMPPFQGGGSWDNAQSQDENDQQGSALNSAVDMVTSAASNIFAYGSGQQQHQPPPMNNPQNIPGQGPPGPLGSVQNQQTPQPIQPTSSLLSTPVQQQQPPPIQVDSSLLSARGSPAGYPVGMAPTQISAASGPPMSLASGPPKVTPPTAPPKKIMTAAEAPPMAASPVPPKNSTLPSAVPLAKETINTPTTAGGGPPPMTASSPGGASTLITTPKQAGKPVASLSPRTTKKLPLPPPSSTLERRKRPATSKFKLPPTYKSTTPTSTPISTKEKLCVSGVKSTVTPKTQQQHAKATDASSAPPMPSTPTTKPTVLDATPKLSNVGPSPRTAQQQQQQQPPVAGPSPAPAPTPAALLSIPSLTSASSEPPTKLSPEKAETTATSNNVPDTPLRSESESESHKLDALPPGWVELVHESTGQKYYWKEEDGTTSWERPVAPAVNTVAESAPPEAKSADPSVEMVSPPINNAAASAGSDANQQPESTTEAFNQLSEGWIEAIDEASGSTYYVNTVDNSTSWTRPTVSDLAMDTPMKQPAQPEQSPEEKDEAEPALQGESATANAPLPPGWEELHDEVSGRSYYVNRDTNVTTWERPTPAAAVVAEEMPEAAGEEKEEMPLVEESPPLAAEEHGTPEVTQQNSNESFEDNTPAPTMAAADTTMAILEELQEPEPPLPPGWTEGLDPDSGRKFYVNEADQSTTWERPMAPVGGQPVADVGIPGEDMLTGTEPSQSAPEVAGEKEEVSLAPELTDSAGNELQDSAEEHKTELPPGWVEAMDPNSGRPYYFNAETNETSWVPPASVPEGPVDQEEGEADDFVMVDSQQGEEGTAPELTHESKKASAVASEGKDSASHISSEKFDDGSALAPGWEEFIEPSTGKPYYINEAQNRTVWEKPLLETASVLSSAPDIGVDGPDTTSELARDESEEAAGEKGGGARSEPVTQETDLVGGESNGTAALPPGWEENFDPLTKTTYFYHEATGRSSWERPVESSEPVPQQEAPTRHTTMDELITPAGEANPAAVGETDNPSAESPDGTARITEESGEPNGDESQEETNKKSELAPGYVEKTDPLSGRVFYLNTADGTSSWKRPVAEPSRSSDQSLPEKSANTNVPELMNGENGETASESNQLPDGAAAEDNLPPGWVAVDDPSTGSKYYFNEVENITSWEKPPSISQPNDPPEEIPSTPVEASKSAEDQHGLPPGWVELFDEASGRPYYVNESTNSTTWERPSMQDAQENIVPGATEEAEPAISDNVTTEEEIAMTSEHSTSEIQMVHPEEPIIDANPSVPPPVDSELPPDWVELFDEASGRPYYVNESTNSTTWERPSIQDAQEDVAPGAAEEAEPAINDNVTTEEEIAMASEHSTSEVQMVQPEEPIIDANPSVPPPVNSELPPGWVEVFDEASGRPYYVNESTDSTTWERPSIQDAQEDVAPGAAEEAEPAINDNVTTEEEIAMASEYSTSEVQMVQPEEPIIDANPSVPPPVDSELPPGWVELFDEASGRPYYVNESTNSTTWERPSIQNEQGVTEEGIPMESEATDKASLSTKNVPTAPRGGPPENSLPDDGESELPPGWIEQVDPSSGATYYFNEIDNVSSWEKPEPIRIEDHVYATHGAEPTIPCEPEPTVETVVSEELPGSSDLPEGWIEAFDESTGDIYYVNQDTNGASWERPTMQADTQEASEHGITATSSTELPQPNPSNEEHTAEQEPAPIDPVESRMEDVSPGEADLPPGWAKQLDQATGNFYYFNAAENRTSWDPPTDEGLIPATTTTNVLAAGATGIEEQPPLTETAAPEVPVSDLPPAEDDGLLEGWVELVDESTGSLYFFNEATNETSWERPLAASGDDAIPTVGSDALLPEGWEEVTDENGDTYYFNQIENLTQWERPVGPPPTAPVVANMKAMGSHAGNLQTNRARPGHSFASFGFGGKLCVWRFTTSRPESIKPVEIFRVSDIAPTHDLVQVETSKQQCGVLGPLDGALPQDVKTYMKDRIERNPKDLLWRLLRIVSISKGKLRTTAGTANPHSPESALVALLLEEGSTKNSSEAQDETNNGGFIPGPVQSAEEETNGKGNHSEKAKFEQIQDLVLKGDRDAAIEFALESNKFDLALLIGSCCGGDVFQLVVKQYAEKVLRRGSPLYTVAMLFSRQNLDSSMWSKCSNELLSSWPYNLSAIISNKIPGWESVAFELGKRLQQLGDVPSAHFCHVVAGLQLSSPTMPHTYMTLLGCDHLLPEAMSLMTPEGLAAFHRTEAYEWAKRRGNKNAIVKTIQPFKLYYAMLLADFGYTDLAGKYVESILHIFGLEGDSSRFDTSVPGRATVPEMCESFEAFKAALVDFEQRLFRSLPEATLAIDTKAPASFPIVEETAPQFIAASPQEGTINGMMSPAESTEADQTFMTAVEPTTSSEPKKKETLARVQRKKPRAEMGGSFGQPHQEKMPAAPQSGPASTHVASAPSSEYQTPAATTAKPSPTTPTPGMEGSSSKSVPAKKKPEPSPKSAPAVMSQSKKGGWLAGIRETITKKLNPDATTADMGDTMQAYYDEDKKVWVFPGEDPAEVAKPLAPPPTPMEMAQKKQEEKPKAPPDMANDPLAAMMAPPQRTPATLARTRAGGGGVPPTPRSLYPGMPPGSGAGAGGGPPGIPSTPQFMVFQPKPEQASAAAAAAAATTENNNMISEGKEDDEPSPLLPPTEE